MSALDLFGNAAPTVSVEPPDFWNIVGERKTGEPGWRWFELKALGKPSDGTRDVLVTGSVPIGKKKDGSPKWGPRKDATQIVITQAELDAAQMEYERTSGHCHRCYGKGERAWSWGVEGTKYRPCERCAGSGKAVAP